MDLNLKKNWSRFSLLLLPHPLPSPSSPSPSPFLSLLPSLPLPTYISENLETYIKLQNEAKNIKKFSPGFWNKTSMESVKIRQRVRGYSMGLYRARASECIRNASGLGVRNQRGQEARMGKMAGGGEGEGRKKGGRRGKGKYLCCSEEMAMEREEGGRSAGEGEEQ
jgi:hypothetical protein